MGVVDKRKTLNNFGLYKLNGKCENASIYRKGVPKKKDK